MCEQDYLNYIFCMVFYEANIALKSKGPLKQYLMGIFEMSKKRKFKCPKDKQYIVIISKDNIEICKGYTIDIGWMRCLPFS